MWVQSVDVYGIRNFSQEIKSMYYSYELIFNFFL